MLSLTKWKEVLGSKSQIQDAFKYIVIYGTHFILQLTHLTKTTIRSRIVGSKMHKNDRSRFLNLFQISMHISMHKSSQGDIQA